MLYILKGRIFQLHVCLLETLNLEDHKINWECVYRMIFLLFL